MVRVPFRAAIAWLLLVAAPFDALEAQGGGGVVISEVHYEPPEGKGLEFVEIHNPTSREVSLDGWRFTAGITYAFPPGASIAPGGYLVVARDRELLVASLGLDEDLVFGDFEGSLENSGEELVLVDAFGAARDALDYDDRYPWPEPAAGSGASLQRLCPSDPSRWASTWTAAPGDSPTPLAPNVRAVCPAPAPPQPRVVISEIHYHPQRYSARWLPPEPIDDDEDGEFVELHNPGENAVALDGWSFEDGIEFEFPPGTVLLPGAYLVVCRNREFLSERHGITNTVGDFRRRLANRGERIALVDAGGHPVDAVRYGDRGKWPHRPDGLGNSLEKITLASPGDDPASWRESELVPGGPFVTLSTRARLDDARSGLWLILNVTGPGEYVIDNVRVERADRPGEDLLGVGDFEEENRRWSFFGAFSDSSIEDGIGAGGSRGLRLRSETGCVEGCGLLDSVAAQLSSPLLEAGKTYLLRFAYRYVGGDAELRVGLADTELQMGLPAALQTPGRANSVAREAVPPWISHRGRYPEEPLPGDDVWITARIALPRGSIALDVRLRYLYEGIEEVVPMQDDGDHGDGRIGDGIYGARLAPFRQGSRVLYRIVARGPGGGERTSPHWSRPGGHDARDWWGFYVDGSPVDSELPVYHLLIDGVDPRDPEDINRKLDCLISTPAAFAFRGELYPDVRVRFRGHTDCFLRKRNLKVTFNKGRYFRGLRKMNFQGQWTDKSLVRQHLAWDLFRRLGMPACATEYCRLHVNSLYHGLFLYLEHPDRRFLARNDLDPDGALYKKANGGSPPAISRQLRRELYETAWEEETLEDRDYSDLIDFIESLHEDGVQPGGPSVEFFEGRLDVERTIGYQLGHVLLNNYDHRAKNHFLYRHAGSGRWAILPWDLDLSFGKFFDPNVEPIGTLNDCLASPGRDMTPWFLTTLPGSRFGLGNHLIEFFFRAGGDHFRRAYLVRLWDLVARQRLVEFYEAVLDELGALLRREEVEDRERWGRYTSTSACSLPPDMASNLDAVREQLGFHVHFLREFLRSNHSEVADHPRLTVSELMVDPPGSSEDGEFIELVNTTGREIDISGWRLAGAVDFTFPEGVRVRNAEVIVVARSIETFRQLYDPVGEARVFGDYTGKLANGGEALRILDRGAGHPATVDLAIYETGGDWPAIPDGHSLELGGEGFGADDDNPRRWGASPAVGGTPGWVSGLFVRGEVNGDGVLNLTDAILLLDFLFLGENSLACPDAGDIDDNGRLEITDVVRLLDFLFQGGEPPVAPFPGFGMDSTDDGLVCP